MFRFERMAIVATAIFTLIFSNVHAENVSGEAEGVKFTITDCKTVGEQLRVYFTVESADKDLKISIINNKTKIYDDEGNQYVVNNAKIGNYEGDKFKALVQELIAGVPVKGYFYFIEGAANANKIVAMDINGRNVDDNKRFELRLKNIAVKKTEMKTPFDKIELDDDLYFKVKKAKISNSKVEVHYIMTNEGPDRKLSILSRQITMIDDEGNSFKSNYAEYGNKKGETYKAIYANPIQGIPTKGFFSFDVKGRKIKEIKVLDIKIADNRFKIYDIPVK